MKKLLKALAIVVCSILAAILLVAAFIFYAPDVFETHKNTVVEGSTTWMADLDDDRSIATVVIPGAHDAGANHAMLSWFSKCQSTDVKTLLNDGIRYLDVRLRVEGDQLVFCHGFCDCTVLAWPFGGALTFDCFLDECYAFLEAHPTEFLVFSVKQEEGDETTEEFQTILNQYIQKNADKWFLSDTILPNVGSARGKIVLTRRFGDALKLGDNAGLYLNWGDQGNRDNQDLAWAASDVAIWSEDEEIVLTFVQDRYKYDTTEKWAAFTASTNEIVPDGIGDVSFLFINFLSTNGNETFGHPYQYAKDLNKMFLAMDDSDVATAWYILDFCDAALAQKVWSKNFK